MIISALKAPTAAPTIEPITLDEAKAHLFITHNDDDAYIGTLITVARQACEEKTDLSLISQTHTGYAGEFSRIMELRKSPVQTISTVKYYDLENVLQTVAATDYMLSPAGARSAVVFAENYSFPRIYARPDAIRIEYIAGFGSAAGSVPAPIKQAMLLLIGSYYAQRESISAGQMAIVPQAVEMLLSLYKNFDW